MLELINRPFLGLPIWIWLIIVVGVVVVIRVVLPKVTGSSSSSGSSSGGSGLGGLLSGGSASSGASSAPPLDQSLYDPSTGIPLGVETAQNPATGLPNYNNLVGLSNTTGTIASTQGNPSGAGGISTTPTAGASSGTQTVGDARGGIYTVGDIPGAGTTLNSIAKYFGYKTPDPIYGNAQNYASGSSTIQPYSLGFNSQLKAGQKIYLPVTG